MRIRYNVTVEDLVAFTLYYCEHSPSSRRQRWVLACVVPGVLLAIAGPEVATILTGNQGNPDIVLGVAMLVMLLLLSGMWLFLVPEQFRRMTAKRTRNLYKEGSTTGTVGLQELEITDSFLVLRRSTGEASLRFSAIDKIVTDKAHTFVFLNSFTAYVIPHDAVFEGNLDTFLELLRKRVSKEHG